MGHQGDEMGLNHTFHCKFSLLIFFMRFVENCVFRAGKVETWSYMLLGLHHGSLLSQFSYLKYLYKKRMLSL